MNFEKSNYDSKSVSYTEDELWQKLASFLTEHDYITRRILSIEFGLSKYKASQWLSRFTGQGLLKKEGTAHQPIYILADKWAGLHVAYREWLPGFPKTEF